MSDNIGREAGRVDARTARAPSATAIAAPAAAAAWAFTVTLAARLATFVVTRLALSIVSRELWGPRLNPGELGMLDWYEMAARWTSGIAEVAWLVGIVSFVVWLVQSTRLAHHVAAPPVELPPPWRVVVAYVIPIVNLRSPYVHMRRIFELSDPALVKPEAPAPIDTDYRTNARVREPGVLSKKTFDWVRAWWIAWLAAVAVFVAKAVATLLAPRPFAPNPMMVGTDADDIRRTVFDTATFFVWLAVIALASRVVRTIAARQAAQLRLIARGGSTPAAIAIAQALEVPERPLPASRPARRKRRSEARTESAEGVPHAATSNEVSR